MLSKLQKWCKLNHNFGFLVIASYGAKFNHDFGSFVIACYINKRRIGSYISLFLHYYKLCSSYRMLYSETLNLHFRCTYRCSILQCNVDPVLGQSNSKCVMLIYVLWFYSEPWFTNCLICPSVTSTHPWSRTLETFYIHFNKSSIIKYAFDLKVKLHNFRCY